MRSTEQKMKQEIQRYLNHGFNLKGAVFQVKELTLHRFDSAVDRAAQQLAA